jgi:hypothetical protein
MLLQVLIAMIAGWIHRHQQHVITSLKAENQVLKAQLPQQRRRLTDTERRRLAALAHPLGRQQRKDTATLATPHTLMRWYQRLIANKFDGSRRRKAPGRPRVDEESEPHAIRMATTNPTWGYRRIQGALAHIGHHIDTIFVRNMVRRHHIDPPPKRRQGGMRGSPFLTLPWGVLAATDFFPVAVATWHGLVTSYGLVVMELSTRRVEIAGITPHPHAACMPQGARPLTEHCDGLLLGKHELIHDRESTCTDACDARLNASGGEPVVLPPPSPNFNAPCARFVRSLKEEGVGRMLFMGEASLRYTLTQYWAHDHAERHHQGLNNQLIVPEPEVSKQTGQVVRRERLGGLRSYYDREAASCGV